MERFPPLGSTNYYYFETLRYCVSQRNRCKSVNMKIYFSFISDEYAVSVILKATFTFMSPNALVWRYISVMFYVFIH
jgi:hypothetical protein